mgnify:FL=1|jgi:hypothetical protein|nr:MAG TPA: hypothetical protein [Caudoviricetes sp.]
MKQATYTTRTEAIEREIIEVISAGDANANDYNVEAIADLVIGDYEDGYALKVDESDFWSIVADNEI